MERHQFRQQLLDRIVGAVLDRTHRIPGQGAVKAAFSQVLISLQDIGKCDIWNDAAMLGAFTGNSIEL